MMKVIKLLCTLALASTLQCAVASTPADLIQEINGLITQASQLRNNNNLADRKSYFDKLINKLQDKKVKDQGCPGFGDQIRKQTVQKMDETAFAISAMALENISGVLGQVQKCLEETASQSGTPAAAGQAPASQVISPVTKQTLAEFQKKFNQIDAIRDPKEYSQQIYALGNQIYNSLAQARLISSTDIDNLKKFLDPLKNRINTTYPNWNNIYQLEAKDLANILERYLPRAESYLETGRYPASAAAAAPAQASSAKPLDISKLSAEDKRSVNALIISLNRHNNDLLNHEKNITLDQTAFADKGEAIFEIADQLLGLLQYVLDSKNISKIIANEIKLKDAIQKGHQSAVKDLSNEYLSIFKKYYTGQEQLQALAPYPALPRPQQPTPQPAPQPTPTQATVAQFELPIPQEKDAPIIVLAGTETHIFSPNNKTHDLAKRVRDINSIRNDSPKFVQAVAALAQDMYRTLANKYIGARNQQDLQDLMNELKELAEQNKLNTPEDWKNAERNKATPLLFVLDRIVNDAIGYIKAGQKPVPLAEYRAARAEAEKPAPPKTPEQKAAALKGLIRSGMNSLNHNYRNLMNAQVIDKGSVMEAIATASDEQLQDLTKPTNYISDADRAKITTYLEKLNKAIEDNNVANGQQAAKALIEIFTTYAEKIQNGTAQPVVAGAAAPAVSKAQLQADIKDLYDFQQAAWVAKFTKGSAHEPIGINAKEAANNILAHFAKVRSVLKRNFDVSGKTINEGFSYLERMADYENRLRAALDANNLNKLIDEFVLIAHYIASDEINQIIKILEVRADRAGAPAQAAGLSSLPQNSLQRDIEKLKLARKIGWQSISQNPVDIAGLRPDLASVIADANGLLEQFKIVKDVLSRRFEDPESFGYKYLNTISNYETRLKDAKEKQIEDNLIKELNFAARYVSQEDMDHIINVLERRAEQQQAR